MEASAIGEHHRDPGVAGLAARLEGFKRESQRGRQSGIFGQPSCEGVVLSGVRDDDPDFLFSDDADQLGKMAHRGIGGFGRTVLMDGSGDRQPVVTGEEV
jgi:hypothetical protein